MPKRRVKNWFSKFKRGNCDLKEDVRSGRAVEFDEEPLNPLLYKYHGQTRKELAKKIKYLSGTIENHLEKIENI